MAGVEKKDEREREGQEKKRRRRKTIGEEGSRKQIAVGFGLTLILSLMFYLPREVKRWWQEFNQAEVITIEKPVGDEPDVSEIVGFKVEIRRREDVEPVVKRLIEDLSGDYGVWVKKLKGEGEFGINEDKLFTAASVIKLPILVDYYRAVDRGELNPERIYVLQEKDRFKYGSGEMQNQPAGTEYSYKEIAYLVANQSDNMGARLLRRFLGQKSRPNEVTPKEIGKLLVELYRGELISNESRQELLANLTNTVLEERLPAGVPTGVRVAHKFGSEAGVVNDCGIVYADNPYVICVLSTGVNDAEAEEILPKISRVVWEWAGR
jgi:beta-lactamase class A